MSVRMLKERMDISRDILVRLATKEDIKEVAEIYLAAFPKDTRSLMGIRTCGAYFDAVLRHPAYRLLVSSKGVNVLGFSVIHIDRKESLSKRWILSSICELWTFALRQPRFLLQRLGTVAFSKIRTSQTLYKQADRVWRTAYIDVIAVDQASRTKEIGKRLIEACIGLARKKGLEELKLTVDAQNLPAFRLYEATGFRRIACGKQTRSYVYRLTLLEAKHDKPL